MTIPAFYQMASFAPLDVQNIKKNNSQIRILDLCKSEHYRQQMMSYFEVVSSKRVGVLEGEYALICDCNLLVGRDGIVIRAASALEESFSSKNINELCVTDAFINAVGNIITFWEKPAIIDDPAILSGIPLENYFHFSLEIFPRIRHFPAARLEKVLVGERALRLPFQTSLLSRAGSGCRFIRAPEVVRVRNPIVAHDSLSDDGIHWLRQVGPKAHRGARRLYIRRGAQSGRAQSGGGLEETSEILDLLNELNFEIIEFGHDNTVDAQVAMIDGAGLIVAAHGAALTNIAYLGAGVSVLEIIGAGTPRAIYAHLCSTLEMPYFAILTDNYSEAGNMILDAATLRECILNMA